MSLDLFFRLYAFVAADHEKKADVQMQMRRLILAGRYGVDVHIENVRTGRVQGKLRQSRLFASLPPGSRQYAVIPGLDMTARLKPQMKLGMKNQQETVQGRRRQKRAGCKMPGRKRITAPAQGVFRQQRLHFAHVGCFPRICRAVGLQPGLQVAWFDHAEISFRMDLSVKCSQIRFQRGLRVDFGFAR